jgi:hypothetical protein
LTLDETEKERAIRTGAKMKPNRKANTTICVDTRFDSSNFPLPLDWPIIAIPATLKPCANAPIILIIGPQYETELAATVPTILLMKRPSITGIKDCTMPIMSAGTESNKIVIGTGPFKIRSRLCSVFCLKKLKRIFACLLSIVGIIIYAAADITTF